MKKKQKRKVGTVSEKSKAKPVVAPDVAGSSDTPLRKYPTMASCAAATGIPLAEIKRAKKQGCQAFSDPPRVDLLLLIRWIFRPANDTELVEDWSQEFARVKTLRERIRLAEDEGRVMDFQNVVAGLGSVMAILFGRLDRMANQLPPSLKGLDELGIKRRIEQEMESVRKDLKAKFAETTKEKDTPNV